MTNEKTSSSTRPATLANADGCEKPPELATMLGRFTSALAHDLRTPLSVIRNSVHFLRTAVPQSAEVADLLGLIDSEVLEINQVFTRLLEIWHAWTPDPRDVDLVPLVKELIAELDHNRMIRWQTDYHFQPAVIWCDRVRFKNALGQLLSNAMYAMKGTGDAVITARQEADGHVIEVRDQGSGVPPELQTTLFDSLVTSKRIGMGLGLTYCQIVVQRHLGTIALVDSSPAGSVFRIQLPLKGPSAVPARPLAKT